MSAATKDMTTMVRSLGILNSILVATAVGCTRTAAPPTHGFGPPVPTSVIVVDDAHDGFAGSTQAYQIKDSASLVVESDGHHFKVFKYMEGKTPNAIHLLAKDGKYFRTAFDLQARQRLTLILLKRSREGIVSWASIQAIHGPWLLDMMRQTEPLAP
jgi:hypothetical protein